MTMHFIREVENLKREILALGGLVEESVQKAIRSVTSNNSELAQEVVRRDDEIDELEVDIEEDCLKILALHQPVAVDLRFIVSVLKINSDLERIGDLSVNIAQRALLLAHEPDFPRPDILSTMAEKARAMLRDSLDALVRWDRALAERVLKSDDDVDAMNRQVYDAIRAELEKGTRDVASNIHMLTVSRATERIADHATNIAEDVLYLIEGTIVRHTAKESRKPGS
mgnify:FL=1